MIVANVNSLRSLFEAVLYLQDVSGDASARLSQVAIGVLLLPKVQRVESNICSTNLCEGEEETKSIRKSSVGHWTPKALNGATAE